MPTPTATTSTTPRRFRLLRGWGTIARVLLSYGGHKVAALLRGRAWAERALPDRHRRNARRVKATILEVQGLFIKVGQLISILSNFLPADFRAELDALQDRIPPRPMAGIGARIRAELGAEPQELFASFEPEPIASASLAQVHAATLADGRRVAVKVQHADIEETARRDLATIRRILWLVERILGIRGLDQLHAEVAATIAEELDFRREADSLEAIAANFPADGEVLFPAIVRERSSQRVLTTLFIEGVKIADLQGLAAYGLDRHVLAERVLLAYCQMIFRDGLYHADPHPGNLLVQPDGRLVFLDFGAVARLSPTMKEGIPQLVEGVLLRKTDQILAALERMGFVARGPEASEIAGTVVDYLYSRFLAGIELESFNLKDLQFDPQLKLEMMADLARLDISLRQMTSAFRVPREWILLERTLLLLAGLCTHLDPDLRPLAVVRPYLQEFLLGSDRDWLALVRKVLKEMALAALAVPEELRRLLRALNQGELEVKVRGLPESAELLYAANHQRLWALGTLATGALAYWARLQSDLAFAYGFAGASGLCLLLLALSLGRARRLQRRGRRRGAQRPGRG
jgi:ubiquinone biosynthesis protein